MNPISQVLLKIDKALQDELITDSGIKFFIDPSYKKEWQASVTATIVALPVKYTKEQGKTLDQLKVGDEVCISYRVVADFSFKGDGHRFMQITEDNPHQQEFMNGRGEMIRKYALPKRSGLPGATWIGMLTDRFRQYVDRCQGTESEVDRWMAQFSYGKTDDYTYNNFFSYNGEDYWKCSPEDIFAKKIGGKIVSIGNRIIGRYVEEPVPTDIASQLSINRDVKIRYQDRLRVLTGGSELGLKENNTIHLNPNHLEKYTFYGKEYYMVKTSSVYGKWSNN